MAIPCSRRGGPEDAAMAIALTAMVLLPLIEVLSRSTGLAGIGRGAFLVQHLTLAVGMIGGLLATRDRRLLTLSTMQWLPSRLETFAQGARTVIGAAVAGGLAIAASQFAAAEREATAGQAPWWLIELLLPLGFFAIAARLCVGAYDAWTRRAAVAAGAGLLLAFSTWALQGPAGLAIGAALLLGATAVGLPIFAALGGLGLLLFRHAGVPVAAMAVEHYRLTTNPALPAIPLFTLAGYVMAEGGASRRLLRAFHACFGWAPGGPAVAVVLSCSLFTAFTGGSGVTILALGGVMMPILLGVRYSRREALGLITGAGSLGILLPPCLPVILYAIIAGVDMKQLYLAGLAPSVLLIALTLAWAMWTARERPETREPFVARNAWRALREAKWDLLLPACALAALFGGWATPVEAAAVTAAYAWAAELLVHRELRLRRDAVRVMREAGSLVGGILLILGVALGLTNYLIDAQIPDAVARWGEMHVHSRWLFLLGLNLLLIAIGGVVEIYAAVVVMAPLLAPIGARLGIAPLHLGVIFLANLELGFIAPPIGLNLLLASSRLDVPMAETSRAALPLLGILFVGVLLMTYWPPLTLAVPALFSHP